MSDTDPSPVGDTGENRTRFELAGTEVGAKPTGVVPPSGEGGKRSDDKMATKTKEDGSPTSDSIRESMAEEIQHVADAAFVVTLEVGDDDGIRVGTARFVEDHLPDSDRHALFGILRDASAQALGVGGGGPVGPGPQDPLAALLAAMGGDEDREGTTADGGDDRMFA